MNEVIKMTVYSRRFALAGFAITALGGGALPAVAGSCEQLSQLTLPNTHISLAQSVAAGAFAPPVPSWAKSFMQPMAIPAAFCRVSGEIRPTADSNIRFELWLPAAGWTGPHQSGGNGGFSGGVRFY